MNLLHTILLVDDDPDDLGLLHEAFTTVGSTYEIIEADNGESALQKLKEMEELGNLPVLVVLDINMPKMDGRQTLIAIQSDEELRAIPIVIFSTSSSPIDRMFFEKRNVAFITKPIELKTLLDVANKLLSYCKY